ncbi:hypothetical protein ABW19_dt0203497 [Dactylella cylindrospora]|nr:hypothetical protein ABW19_dt0203497 [Dactylella cylindrospora]
MRARDSKYNKVLESLENSIVNFELRYFIEIEQPCRERKNFGSRSSALLFYNIRIMQQSVPPRQAPPCIKKKLKTGPLSASPFTAIGKRVCVFGGVCPTKN